MRTSFLIATCLSFALNCFAVSNSWAAEVPAAGKSPRIDAIRKSGVLRVAVLHNMPWLVENTSGKGAKWSGPAWLLANAFAKQLGVRLQEVAVSHETKIPVLAANQVDIAITPLAESPERLKVVDFVHYSNTSVCVFGLKSNPKFSKAKTVDDLNSADVTIAFLLGAVEETWVKGRFNKAKHRGVITSSVIPIDDIMSGRADAAPINRVQWPALQAKLSVLAILPTENNCQDSKEKSQPIGMAIDKGQDVFRTWLEATTSELSKEAQAEEARVIKASGTP
ncbi:transporter substrate-binding domain-containing protein [Bradyrhizobium sp. 157]|uniref:substrate-binding periplasmic protein n=1 Tax=Bradyrhizobium sp. 157 TaxID=2782631 RepID=UPI001FF84078|nr:transporter substrate-binding domain-containing protein [Bradyrhizobium sp. 157]MCK1641444.1 transporter substrate-binding domain-containing protein [Bradyrhizobium sp. 157]